MSHAQLQPIAALLDAALGNSPKAQRQYENRNRTPTPTPLVTVDAIRARVLTPAQLDAIARIQDGLLALGQLERGINDLAKANGIKTKPMCITQVGDLWHEIEGLLFAHNVAAAKLRNGGQPVQQQTTKREAA